MSHSPPAFERLHPKLQRWIYQQGWPSLRPIQELATEPILRAEQDVILAAATAGGKTEAAFLPIFTSLTKDRVHRSVAVLCVSPLKALINDQFDRLEELGSAVAVAVHRWHGDVSSGRKRKLLKEPAGVLLITPESLEALFCRHGPRLRSFFTELRYVVVDELHAFIGSERGRQLQSLLHRLELAVRRRIPRIALSATLGDLGLAAEFLRPGRGDEVELIEDRETGQEIKLQIRGYRQRAIERGDAKPTTDRAGQGDMAGDTLAVAHDLFGWLRGGHHLVFANRRANVEQYADLLRKLCENLGVPNEFWPHHGSLSRELREDAERAINDRGRPTTLIATTTLELGIDVGAIESIVQIGAPPSVSALRQRLGRSGRHGDAAVLRIVVQEPELTPKAGAPTLLRPRLIQAIAMVELLVDGWVEPPPAAALHLSTLVQQTLSLLAQSGGADAQTVWRALCGSGPFKNVDTRLFTEFLRGLGAADLIIQLATGELILGLQGERLVDHYSFYAAFRSPEEYRLVNAGRTLGQLPIGHPLFVGLLLIFGGRRWRVLAVDEEHKVVDLAPAAGGRIPSFLGTGGPLVHDRVRQEMLTLYESESVPRYIDPAARDLLAEARSWFERLGLRRRSVLPEGRSTVLFPWSGDRVVGTLALLLGQAGLQISVAGYVLEIEHATPDDVIQVLRRLVAEPWPEATALARSASQRRSEKFHPFLADNLLSEDYAASCLDLPAAKQALERILNKSSDGGSAGWR